MFYVLAIGLGLTLAAVVWYFFVRPLGTQFHERELEMVRRKLERLEQKRRAREGEVMNEHARQDP